MINREIEYRENLHLFRSFCSFLCLTRSKKFNVANVLLVFLQERNARDLFKTLMSLYTDFDATRIFLEFDPTLYKSKYIMKYLNNKKNRKKILK
jgi:hypothetical protein